MLKEEITIWMENFTQSRIRTSDLQNTRRMLHHWAIDAYVIGRVWYYRAWRHNTIQCRILRIDTKIWRVFSLYYRKSSHRLSSCECETSSRPRSTRSWARVVVQSVECWLLSTDFQIIWVQVRVQWHEYEYEYTPLYRVQFHESGCEYKTMNWTVTFFKHNNLIAFVNWTNILSLNTLILMGCMISTN